MSASINKRIVLVHGHGPQPEASALLTLWRDALAAGLKRDRPALVPALDAVDLQLAFYADAFPQERQEDYDPALDLADLQNAYDRLAALDKPRRFQRREYDRLPGKSSLQEFLADAVAPFARGLGLGQAPGRHELPDQRYPNNLTFWHNIAAEDDAVCHDETVLNDFSAMLNAHRVSLSARDV